MAPDRSQSRPSGASRVSARGERAFSRASLSFAHPLSASSLARPVSPPRLLPPPATFSPLPPPPRHSRHTRHTRVRRSGGGNEWSWQWESPDRNPPGASYPDVGFSGLSIAGTSQHADPSVLAHADADAQAGRQAGGVHRGQIRRGPAGPRGKPLGASSQIGASGASLEMDGVWVGASGASADAPTGGDDFEYDLEGEDLDLDIEGTALDDDPSNPTQRTHDVIISEIEDINLEDYMARLEPPTFSEEMAEEIFLGTRPATILDDDAIAFPPKPETPGRAGRRGWSRQGTRGIGGTPGVERPQTGGLDDADCVRSGVGSGSGSGLGPDDVAADDVEFAHIDADIYDDSDDDSWGPETHEVSLASGGPADHDTDEDVAERRDGARFGAEGKASNEAEDEDEDDDARRRRRRERERGGDEFVVMSTPKGLRRVPSARRRAQSANARGARPGIGAGFAGTKTGATPARARMRNSQPLAPSPADPRGGSRGDAARAKPARVSSAGAAHTQGEVSRRLELLQRPPSRQRPPPEALDLFHKGRVAGVAAAAAAAPAVPGLNKVSRPAGLAASMLRL